MIELEVGAQRISNRDRSEDTCFPVQLNLGVSTWFDLRFGWSGPMLRRDSQGDSHQGGGDPVVGGQALLLNQGTEGLDLGLAYWHKVPRASVSKGIGTGKHDDTLLLTASRTWGRWGLDVNAGANWISRCHGEGRVRQAAAGREHGVDDVDLPPGHICWHPVGVDLGLQRALVAQHPQEPDLGAG